MKQHDSSCPERLRPLKVASPYPERLRPLKAAAIVLALLLAAPGVEAISRFAVPPQEASASDAGLDAASLTGAGDAFAALERIEGVASAGDADVPAAFSEEIGFLPGASDIRVGGDGSVVGYTVSLSSSIAYEQVVAHMEARGWTTAALGDMQGATFVKQSGACTWALATCTQVGSSTSIVWRVVIE